MFTAADLAKRGIRYIEHGSRVQTHMAPGDVLRPIAVKPARCPRFSGDFSQWKAWVREQQQSPGIFVPVKTVNELNDHSYWRNRQRRAKEQHEEMADVLAKVKRPSLPVRVTFTRYAPSPRPLDSDGAFAAMKFVRDSVAKWLGVDDGGDEIEWAWPVKQVKAKHYGVRVEIVSTKGNP